jgi:hypothetical protein
MALQLAHTLESDIVVSSAYHRITRFSGGTVDRQIELEVSVYKDAAARQAGKPPAAVRRLTIPYVADHSGTTLANLYAGLKELPEYAGAGNV